MIISRWEAVNFRNYPRMELAFDRMLNVFYGANAQGKTNILESIFYASYGFSHRTNLESNLVTFGQNALLVAVQYQSSSGSHEVRLKKYFDNTRRKKEFFLDRVKITPKEHYGSLAVVLFSPEDLQFIKGEPALRRRFLDMQIAQTNKRYWEFLVQYNRVLLQRNKLLKMIREGESSLNALTPWDEEFCKLAAAICELRQPALLKLQRLANEIHQHLTGGDELGLHYLLKNWHEEVPEGVSDYYAFFQEALRSCRSADLGRGSTNVGPHRDDLVLTVNHKDLKNFGSQGQQRSVALALKLSQLEYLHRETGEYPVLLLDDVLSELDAFRRTQLLSFINDKIQTFITVNDRSLVPDLPEGRYYQVENGKIM